MNRSERRANQFKRPQRWDRNRLAAHPAAAFNAVRMSQTYTPDDAARLCVGGRMAWYKLTNGMGSMDDFDVLAGMINTTYVLAMGSDADDIVREIFDRAMDCMAQMRARYERIGRFGADAQALEHVPVVLDAIDTIMSNITPRQAVDALEKSMKLIESGHVITPACFMQEGAA